MLSLNNQRTLLIKLNLSKNSCPLILGLAWLITTLVIRWFLFHSLISFYLKNGCISELGKKKQVNTKTQKLPWSPQVTHDCLRHPRQTKWHVSVWFHLQGGAGRCGVWAHLVWQKLEQVRSAGFLHSQRPVERRRRERGLPRPKGVILL